MAKFYLAEMVLAVRGASHHGICSQVGNSVVLPSPNLVSRGFILTGRDLVWDTSTGG